MAAPVGRLLIARLRGAPASKQWGRVFESRAGSPILRRLTRLLPGFVVATALGALTVTWAADAAAHANIPGDAFVAQVIGWRHLWFANGAANVVLHLTMLRGLVVPEHQYAYAFLPPGWSVSLKWQYYLIAPLLLKAVLRRPTWTLAASMLLAIAWGAIGQRYASPSGLPALGFYFVIGALTHVRLRQARLPSAVAVSSLSLPFVLTTTARLRWRETWGPGAGDPS